MDAAVAASLLGVIEADPLVVGVLIGAIALLAVAFVVRRIARRKGP